MSFRHSSETEATKGWKRSGIGIRDCLNRGLHRIAQITRRRGRKEGMDGMMEGWKGCLCLNHRFYGLHGLRGEEGMDGRVEGWKECLCLNRGLHRITQITQIRGNGWKDGRVEGMSLSEPRITQDYADYAEKKDCGLESFVKEENGSVRNRAYQGWCKNRGLEFPSTEEKITNPKM